MATHQAERLMHHKRSTHPLPPRDVQDILDEIVVKPAPEQQAKSVQDFISQDSEDQTPTGENRFVKAFLSIATGSMYAIAIVAAALVTLGVVDGIRQLLFQE